MKKIIGLITFFSVLLVFMFAWVVSVNNQLLIERSLKEKAQEKLDTVTVERDVAIAIVQETQDLYEKSKDESDNLSKELEKIYAYDENTEDEDKCDSINVIYDTINRLYKN